MVSGMTDILSDVLDTVALKAAIYFRADFHPEFGIAVPTYGRAARFHLVVQGNCYVTLEGGKRVRLQPGDLVLVPRGAAHLLSSSATTTGTPLADVMVQAGFTGAGPFVVGSGVATESCQMVCGHFSFADGADHPLLRSIPDLLHITAADRTSRPMLDDVLRLIVRRMFENEPGAAASVSRLSEVLFIEAMRAGIAQAPDISRLMSAVYDPQIGKSLRLIHGDVAYGWTVESLAAAVGMSRSRFARAVPRTRRQRANGLYRRLATAAGAQPAGREQCADQDCRPPDRLSLGRCFYPCFLRSLRLLTQGAAYGRHGSLTRPDRGSGAIRPAVRAWLSLRCVEVLHRHAAAHHETHIHHGVDVLQRALGHGNDIR